MTTIGVSFEGFPHVRFKTLDDGHVIPDASVEELNERHRECLEKQIAVAVELEALGYDYIVHAEHHSNLLWSVSPNPVLTHTAIARETDDVRLLQMANILPWYEPVRLAEQLSMLDVLSDGRLDVGIGRGLSDPAAETMGQYWGGTTTNEVKNRLSFEEKYDILLEAWTDQFVTHQGEFHRIPPGYADREVGPEVRYFSDEVTDHEPGDHLSVTAGSTTLGSLPVLPQPEQSPHPQLWKPALSPQSAEWAARRGMNICTHVIDLSETKEMVDAYYDAAERAGWPDRRSEYDGDPFRRGWDERRNRGIGIIVPVFNPEIADEDARRRWRRTLEYSESRSESIEIEEGRSDGPLDADGTDEEFSVDVDEFVEEGDVPIVGDAEEITDRLCHIERTLELEDAFIIVDANTLGLTYEERIEQFRSIAEDVRPSLEETSLTVS